SGDLATVKVKARLDLSGVLNVTSAYTVEEVEVEEPVEQAEAKEGQEPAAAPEMRKVKKLVRKADLTVLQASQCLDAATLTDLAKRERDMHTADVLVGATEVAKNSLEEYIYEARAKVEGEYAAFIEAADQKQFLAKLMEAEDWLYDEGDDTTKDAYVEKLAGLKALGEPAAERFREDKERPKAARELRDTIAQWADRATSQEERYAHITSEERQRVIDRIEKVQEWLDEKLDKQAQRPKWDAPTIFANEIAKQSEDLAYFATPIMNRPKPEPKPEEVAAAAAAPELKQEEADGSATPQQEMDVD
ncbi:adenyl-nucleotide exchange factor sse1, partial [Coemansia sp. RSA 1694]